MAEALVLIDIQRDYFPGGRMEVVNVEAAANNAQALLATFRQQGRLVVHVQHVAARPGATFFLPGSVGVEIHPSVLPTGDEQVIVKHFPNSFRDTGLDELLREHGIQAGVFCGMMSHMCVDATVRAAFDLGFACTVAEDACAARNLAFGGIEVPAASVHAAYMAALAAVYARVVSTAEAIGMQ